MAAPTAVTATNRQYQPNARPSAPRNVLSATHRYVNANNRMNPPPRIEARSPLSLPWIMSVTAATTPTKPVKRFRTVTSRSPSSEGCAAAAESAAPPGASAAARAWPNSQIPFTTRTAPTYSSTTPSNIWPSSSSVAENPRWCRRVGVRHRTPRLLGGDLRFVDAFLLAVEQAANRLGKDREARRREHPPGRRPTQRAGGGRARVRHPPCQVEVAAVRAGERVDRHA